MKRTKLILFIAALLALLTAVAACTTPPPAPDKAAADATITGRPTDDTLPFEAGGTLQLGVKFYGADGAELAGADAPEAEWTSGTPATATVDQTGKVTQAAPGRALIGVRAKGTTVGDSFTLTLVGDPTGLAISGKPDAEAEYTYGATFDLSCEVTPSGDYDVTWATTDADAAYITGEGKNVVLNIGMKKGSATITASLDGWDVSDSFTVKAAGEVAVPIDLTRDVTWSDNYNNVTDGRATREISSDREGGAVTFATNPETAVDYGGFNMVFDGVFVAGGVYTVAFDYVVERASEGSSLHVKGLYGEDNGGTQSIAVSDVPSGERSYIYEGFTSNGNNTILFYWGATGAEVEFTVYNVSVKRHLLTDGVAFTGKPAGNTVQLSADTLQLATNAAGFALTFTSSDTDVAAVNPTTGLVTLQSAGTTVLRVSVAGTAYSDEFTLTVTNDPTGVSVTGKPTGGAVEFTENGTIQLGKVISGIVGTYAGAVVWHSDDTEVATVNQDGLVTQIGPGSTVITVSLAGTAIEDSFTLTLAADPALTVVGDKPDPETPYAFGTAFNLSYEIFFASDAAGVVWSSDDEEAAFITGSGQNAVLHIGMKAGEAVITLSLNGGDLSDSFTVKAAGEVAVPIDLTTQAVLSNGDAGKTGAVLSAEASGHAGGAARFAETNITWGGFRMAFNPNPFVTGARYTVEFDLDVAVASKGSTLYITGLGSDTVSVGSLTAETVGKHVAVQNFVFTGNADTKIYLFWGAEGADVTFTVYNFTVKRHLLASNVEITNKPANNKIQWRSETLQLATNAAGFDLTFTSSNADAATVDAATGLVTLTGTGTTVIRVEVADTRYYDEFTLTVANDPTGVSITNKPAGNTAEFVEHGTIQLGKVISGVVGTYTGAVEWISSAEGVATVNQDGLVTQIGSGSTVITVLLTGTAIEDHFTLTIVADPVLTVIGDKPDPETPYAFGTAFNLSYEIFFASDAAGVDWSSDDEETAFITGSGQNAVLHIGMKAGEAEITLSLNGGDLSDSFTVKAAGEVAVPIDLTTQAVLSNGDAGKTGAILSAEASGHAGGAVRFAETSVYYGGFRMAFDPNPFVTGARYTVEFDLDVDAASAGNALYIRGLRTNDVTVSGLSAETAGRHVAVEDFIFTGNADTRIYFYWGADSADVTFTVYNFTVKRYLLSDGVEITNKPADNKIQWRSETLQLATNAAGFDLTFTSSNEDAATVDAATGLVTLIGTGTTVIRVEVGGTRYYDEFTLEVIDAVTAVGIKGKPTGTVYLTDETIGTLTVDTYPGYSTPYTFEWVSSNTEVATVDAATGVVTLLTAGTTDITVYLKKDGNYYPSPESKISDVWTLTVVGIQVTIAAPVSKVIDVKNGPVLVELGIVCNSAYDAESVEWKLTDGDAGAAAVTEAGAVTFSKSSVAKVKVELWYGEAKADEMYFTAIDSSKELAGAFVGTEVTENTPFGAASGWEKETVANTYSAGVFQRADGQNFEVGKVYRIVFDLKVIRNGSGASAYIQYDTAGSKPFALPNAAGDYVLDILLVEVSVATDKIRYYHGSGATDHHFVISNVRFWEYGSETSATVDSVPTPNVVTNVANNAVVAANGDIEFAFSGGANSYPGARSIQFNLPEGEYTVTFDVTLNDLSGGGHIYFNDLGSSTFININTYVPGQTYPLSFNVSVGDTGIKTLSIFTTNSAQGGASGIISNIVITTVVES